jgi:probable F420-dependent oxidoreductase
MQQPPEIGLILALTIRGLAIQSYGEMSRVVREADTLNYDSVWLCDHFLTLQPDDYTTQAGVGAKDNTRTAENSDNSNRSKHIPLLECWTALSALSRETNRLGLGTSVLCNSYRHPAVLAKMAATLDVISDGRLQLGLGAGWFQAEYDAYGIPFPKASVRIAQLDESLEIIRRIWTEKHPTFKGTHFSIDGAVCNPPPVQRPHPPIWIGGEGDNVHRVAARRANGVNMRWWSPERFKTRATFLRDACREAGRDPDEFRMSATLLVIADDDPKAVEEQKSQFAAIPSDGIVAGSPAYCIDRLKQYLDVGVRHFLFTVPHVTNTNTLRLVGEQVIPALKAI